MSAIQTVLCEKLGNIFSLNSFFQTYLVYPTPIFHYNGSRPDTMNTQFHRNTFSCFVIITWWKNQEYLFAGMLFDSAARKPGSEHDSIGDDWGNSEFQWEGRWSNTDVLLFTETSVHREWARTYARCRSQPFRSVHRQQHHSIIPVERQSIYCWLTGIQSPFPKGLGKKEWHAACEETHSYTRLMGQVWDWFMRHPVL